MATSIIVDDSDASITYSAGEWEDGPAQQYPPFSYYNNTFHHLKSGSSGGTVLYTFSGTSFILAGAAVEKDSNPFQYQCKVDGNNLQNVPFSMQVGVLCQQDNLLNATHTIALTATRNQKSKSQLWLDYIIYTPSFSPLPTDSLYLPSNSPEIEFVGNWDASTPTSSQGTLQEMSTIDSNAVMSVNFTGQSITWFNCPSGDNKLQASSVIYTLGGGMLNSSSVDGMPILLDASSNSSGQHRLNVTYSGGPNQKPLTSCGIATSPNLLNPYDKPASEAASSVTTSAIPAFSQPDSAPSNNSKATTSNHTAVIVGAVLSGTILGALIIIGVLLLRRHRRRQETPSQFHFESPMTRNIMSPTPTPALSTSEYPFSNSSRNPPSMAKFLRPVVPYRSSMPKSIYSVRSFRSFSPSPQTAQVGSEYGRSSAYTPNGTTGNILDTELER